MQWLKGTDGIDTAVLSIFEIVLWSAYKDMLSRRVKSGRDVLCSCQIAFKRVVLCQDVFHRTMTPRGVRSCQDMLSEGETSPRRGSSSQDVKSEGTAWSGVTSCGNVSCHSGITAIHGRTRRHGLYREEMALRRAKSCPEVI